MVRTFECQGLTQCNITGAWSFQDVGHIQGFKDALWTIMSSRPRKQDVGPGTSKSTEEKPGRPWSVRLGDSWSMDESRFRVFFVEKGTVTFRTFRAPEGVDPPRVIA